MRFDITARSVFDRSPARDIFADWHGSRFRLRVFLGDFFVDLGDRLGWLWSGNLPFAAFDYGFEEIDVTGSHGFPATLALHPFAGALAQTSGDFGAIDQQIHVLEKVIFFACVDGGFQ